MKTPEYREISQSTNHQFRTLLSNWFLVTKKYVEKLKNDAPWIYGERASIGFVAAAVWKSGGVALEEYWAKKDGVREAGYVGRCDLYFKLGSTGFIAEAKKIHSPFAVKESVGRIQTAMDQACSDTIGLRGGETKLAIVCVSLEVSRSKEKELEKMIKQWTSRIKDHPLWTGSFAAAYLFPRSSRGLMNNEKACPGCAIFIKKC